VEGAVYEAELRVAWTRANLAGYGAYLRACGDARGDLIEVDHQIARDGSNAVLVARRAGLLATLGLALFDASEFGYGFVDELRLHEDTVQGPPTIFGVFATTPMAPYLRGLRLSGDPRFMTRELEAVAKGSYPWLARIKLELMAPPNAKPLIGRALVAKLRTAAPQLVRIEALRFGRFPVVAGPVHPATQVISDPPEPRLLVLELGGQQATIELGRLARLHAGVVDTLSPVAREAWAELRFAIAYRVSVGGTALSADVFRAALAELDPAMYYVSDWDAVRARLAALDTIPITVR